MYIIVMIVVSHNKNPPCYEKSLSSVYLKIWQIYTASCAGHGEERESNCEAYWRCAYCGLVWFMYKGILVTSLSETVVFMQQFLSNVAIHVLYFAIIHW